MFVFSSFFIIIEWLGGYFNTLLPAMITSGGLILLWAKSSQMNTARKAAHGTHENSIALFLLPVSALIILLSFVFVPGNTVSWQSRDVYRAFERVNNYLANYTGFSRPRNSFSIGRFGFMPMGARLGGAVTLSDEKVLQVRASKPILLRGTIYNEYTGSSWADNLTSKRYRFDSNESVRLDSFDNNRPALSGPMASEVKKFKEQLTMTLTPLINASSTLFTPYRGLTAVNSVSFLAIFPFFNTEGEVFHTSDMRAGDSYTITAEYLNYQSADFKLLMDDLMKMGLRDNPDFYQGIIGNYLALPPNIEEGVYTLAKNATAGLENDYDKACAIKDLLKKFNYTLSPKDPPKDMDFVSFFVDHSSEGYCTYFATAMAVMARMEGIPSRYVEGYMMTDDTKEEADYVLKGQNAHAWAELYFQGIGWIPFDATPSGNAPSDTSGAGTEASGYDPRPTIPIPTDRNAAGTGALSQKDKGLTLLELLAYAWIVPVAALAFLLLWIVVAVIKTKVVMSLGYVRRKYKDSRLRCAYYYGTALKLLAYYNYPLKKGETLYAYAARIDRWLRLGAGSFQKVADLMVRISYSDYQPTYDDVVFMERFRRALARYTYDTVGPWFYMWHQIMGIKGNTKKDEAPKTQYYLSQR